MLNTVDFSAVRNALLSAKDDYRLFNAIVNTPFNLYKVETALLFLGVIVLLQVNKKNGTIDRIALSANEIAGETKKRSAKQFEEIRIPVGYEANIIAKAIKLGLPQGTTDWQYMFNPELTAEEARLNQASGGIAFSAVYPLKARDGGALIFSYYQYVEEIGAAQHEFMKRYARIVDEALSAK